VGQTGGLEIWTGDIFLSPSVSERTSNLDFCLTVHHQLGKVIQMNQLDATMIYLSIRSVQRPRWSRGSVLAFSTQVRGFKPGRRRRIFKGEKSSAHLPSEGE